MESGLLEPCIIRPIGDLITTFRYRDLGYYQDHSGIKKRVTITKRTAQQASIVFS